MTAAHCVVGGPGQPVPASLLDVLVGTQDLGSGGTRIHVDKVLVDPNYDQVTHTHDLAVVHLALTTSARPMALGDASDLPPAGRLE